MKNTLLLLLFYSVLMPLHAQRIPVRHNNAQWLHYFLQVRINPHWSWNSDSSLRTSHTFQDWAAQLMRTGMTYQVGPWLTYTSVGYFRGYNEGQLAQREVRLSQDLGYIFNRPKWSLNQRIRVENRLIKPVNAARFSTFRYRLRSQAAWPIYHSKSGHRANILLSDELFLHRPTPHTPFIESNRLQGGLQWQWRQNWVITTQYVFNFSKRLKPDIYEQTNIFWLTVMQRLNLKKEAP